VTKKPTRLAKAAARPAVKVSARKSVVKQPARSAISRLSKVTAGGYTVFGSPVEPVHRTKQQIVAAIAELI